MTLGLLATLSLSACSGDGATAPGATLVGNYTLSTIDSKPLPYSVFADTGYTLDIVSGSLSIDSNGKWVSKITSRETVAGYMSTYNDSTFGTWTAASGTATLMNVETSVGSSATWTQADVTVSEVDGANTRKVVYRKN
jgi:hypothetical protein